MKETVALKSAATKQQSKATATVLAPETPVAVQAEATAPEMVAPQPKTVKSTATKRRVGATGQPTAKRKHVTAKETPAVREPRTDPTRSLVAAFSGIWQRLRQRLAAHWRRRESERQLRLAETVSLGEKRFVALVEVGAQRFLIGGTPQSLTLLGRLPPAAGEFERWFVAARDDDRQVM